MRPDVQEPMRSRQGGRACLKKPWNGLSKGLDCILAKLLGVEHSGDGWQDACLYIALEAATLGHCLAAPLQVAKGEYDFALTRQRTGSGELHAEAQKVGTHCLPTQHGAI